MRAAEVGVLATLGITDVPVYRRPVVAVVSSGDELVDRRTRRRAPGEIRDSNRYAIAASLRAMGAHAAPLSDICATKPDALESALRACARANATAVVVTGGSSVGERDRLPDAVARSATPGVIVHGLRVKPGKPTLFGADGEQADHWACREIPTSALMMLEAVAAPIVAALTGRSAGGARRCEHAGRAGRAAAPAGRGTFRSPAE